MDVYEKKQLKKMLSNKLVKISDIPVFFVKSKEESVDFGKYVYELLVQNKKFPRFQESAFKVFEYQQEYTNIVALQLDLARFDIPFQNRPYGVYLLDLSEKENQPIDNRKMTEIIKEVKRLKSSVVFIFCNYSNKSERFVLEQTNAVVIKNTHNMYFDSFLERLPFKIDDSLRNSLEARFLLLNFQDFEEYFSRIYPFLLSDDSLNLEKVEEWLGLQNNQKEIGFRI
ncbi:MAG: hypothetical protein PUB19_01705 [Lachnospiraceae bacterium]|nr:hypothetical protein [Lachnospiraceae bacterium]